MMRRCQIVLASARGEIATHIARHLSCDNQTVRNAIHAFNKKGLGSLQPGSSIPHPIGRVFEVEQAEHLRTLAAPKPAQFRPADQPLDAGLGG